MGDLSALRPLAPSHAGCFSGSRHHWNILQGQLGPDVLEWLRADDGFASAKMREPRFHGAGTSWRSEEGRKVLYAGKLGNPASLSCCGLSVKEDLLLQRVTAWRNAFFKANTVLFGRLWSDAQVRLSGFCASALGDNGAHVLRHSVERQIFSVGEIHVTEPGDSARGFWDEPRHQDGARSILHLSLTLFGRRDVRCENGRTWQVPYDEDAEGTEEEKQEEDRRGAPGEGATETASAEPRAEGDAAASEEMDGAAGSAEIIMPCVPGTVYMGQASAFTSALHVVRSHGVARAPDWSLCRCAGFSS